MIKLEKLQTTIYQGSGLSLESEPLYILDWQLIKISTQLMHFTFSEHI